MVPMRGWFILLLLMTSSLSASAVSVSLSSLLQAGHDTVALGKLDHETRDELARLLTDMDTVVVDEGLLYEYSEHNIVLEDGCNYASKIKNIDARLLVDQGSGLEFQLDSLSDSSTFLLNLDLVIDASGRIEQKFGRKVFGTCYLLGRDNFDFTVSGHATLHLTASLDLQISKVAEGFEVSPVVDIVVALDGLDYRVNVDGALLDHLTESVLEDGIAKALAPDEIVAKASAFGDRLQQQITDAVGAQTSLLKISDLDASQLAALDELIHLDLAGTASDDYINENLPALLHALLVDDPKYLQDYIASVASCGLLQNTLVDLPLSPTFRQVNGQCQKVDVLQLRDTESLYLDDRCTRSFHFSPLRWVDYCSETLDSRRLGNASIKHVETSAWQLSPGTRLGIGIQSLEGHHPPWLTRRSYKKVDAVHGSCELEMRVYKQDIAATGLKPMVALHGGSWSSRVLGFIGLESMISPFTEAGYVVFVPFYRLTDTKEGTTACHGVTGAEIRADVNDAFDWVMQHSAEFGAAGPVSLFGQSAGAYLALSLATDRQEYVANALLMYPPTDFARMIEQLNAGVLSDKTRQGQKAMEQFLGRSLSEASSTDPDVIDNSFPALINRHPQTMPPMWIIHGAVDDVVPVDQSRRLCRALSGTLDSSDALAVVESNPLRRTFQCGTNGSQLHIIEQGNHALDACVFSLICPAGNRQSQQVVSESLQEAQRWLLTNTRTLSSARVQVLADNVDVTAEASGSGGGSLWLFSGWLLLLKRFRTGS